MTKQKLAEIIYMLRTIGSDTGEYEAKRCVNNLSSDIWESVSAFANTNGGTLILGLSEEDGFTPAASFDAKKTLDRFVSGMGDGGADGKRIENAPRYFPSIVTFENTPLLIIDIEENSPENKPCHLKDRALNKGSYKRIWDKDVLLSSTELFEICNRSIATGADRRIVGRKDDLDDELVNNLLSRKEGSRAFKGAKTKDEKLRRLGVLNSEGGASFAGLIVLGTYPQQFFPKLVVDIATHPDNEKSKSNGPRFIDRSICEGGLLEMVEGATEAIARNLRRMSVINGTSRHEELEIPKEVLREAIANALVHREYDEKFIGQSVQVDIYPNRVEITNPGGLWGGVTKENLANGISACRNDLIMNLLANTPISPEGGPVVEGNGSGIPFMVNEMKSKTLRVPEFHIGLDRFTLVLGRYGTEIIENKKWIEERTNRPLTHDEETLILLLRDSGNLGIPEIRSLLKIDSDEIRKLANQLESDGLVIQANGILRLKSERPKASLSENGSDRLSPITIEILNALDYQTPLSSSYLSKKFDRSTRTIQRHLKILIELGTVKATAPETSSDRKYIRCT